MSSVAPATAVGTGDEAVAFSIESEVGGIKNTARIEAVRKGDTVALFFTERPGASAEAPTTVIEAQLKKLA
ncbi:hypothetical protein [Streptomyces sp. NPDC059874]|uniref:hypothetical protein n=1 Tax=Streptomyces sp. NPDC059874 TaxID=3346983 RepID=UPI0036514B56